VAPWSASISTFQRGLRLKIECPDALAGEASAGAAGLTFISHLDGERTPDLPTASGHLLRLSSSHGTAEIARAVLEGVTFGLAYAFRTVERAGVTGTESIVTGGGARSDTWAQLCADVFGTPVVRPNVDEAAAVGAAKQVRLVVNGQRPGRPPHMRAFEPVASLELEAAGQRSRRAFSEVRPSSGGRPSGNRGAGLSVAPGQARPGG
jgi:xylulokinase